MLNVRIVEPKVEEVIELVIHRNDINTIIAIREKVGVVAAIKAFRWLTKDKVSLLDAKNYVEGL